jgi:hypothetical protein
MGPDCVDCQRDVYEFLSVHVGSVTLTIARRNAGDKFINLVISYHRLLREFPKSRFFVCKNSSLRRRNNRELRLAA